MKKYILLILTAIALWSCTKWGYVDTGIHDVNLHANRTMYEYFQTDPYNWGITKAMVDKAGLKDLFEGKDAQHPKIMFLGIVSNTIEAWMMKNGHNYEKDKLEGISETECRNLILSYVFDNIQHRDLVPEGERGATLDESSGGINLTSIGGNKVWLYARKTPYNGLDKMKITSLISVSMDTQNTGYIASAEIIVKNGLVHSLDDGFILRSDFK